MGWDLSGGGAGSRAVSGGQSGMESNGRIELLDDDAKHPGNGG